MRTTHVTTVLVVLVLLGSGVAPSAIAQTSGQTTVSVTAADSVAVGSSTTATLRATGVPSGDGVGAFTVILTYDPAVVSVEVTDSDYIVESSTPNAGVLRVVGYTSAKAGATGDVDLANLDIEGKAADSVTIETEVETLVDTGATSIANSTQDASIRVTGDSDSTDDTDDSGSTDDGPDGSSGSSSGGPSVGSSASSISTSTVDGGVAVDIRDIEPFDPVRVSLDGVEQSGVRLSSLTITLGTAADASLKVTSGTQLPASTPSLDTDSLSYLEIDHDVDDSSIDSVEFAVSVSASKLAEHGIDPSEVRLYRYHDGSWQALPTSVVDESDGDVMLTATSPGLSVFAVGRAPTDPSFAVSNGTLATPEVTVGDDVVVTAMVTNTGQKEGQTTVDLHVDGSVRSSKTVTLDGGETATMEFTVQADSPGTYAIAVGETSIGNLRVRSVETTTPAPTTTESTPTTSTLIPGFSVLSALLAVLLGCYLAVRRDWR